MKHLILAALIALPLPAAAQEADGEGMMQRGLRLFMDGLRQEMEPALRDLEGLAVDAAPFLRELQSRLGTVVEDLDAYEAPEILPNGDILIRRREPLPPDAFEDIEPNPDGSVDL
ncbi:hypothetical protein JSE7799_02497 [Jannaschia seosinensis]|uniref:AAA+ family ATPase n=1 Tax=Jannaschia seosinensis TaxID=313367 RepID=A0A0M7BC53_9RHOB|nr:hypothetical protein [Jannaschia seosinensis]CUH39769.1 hypothetical protein JSE7799_02497 [Jannaschia seosinensis]